VTVSAVCRRIGITRQNYYARHQARQRQQVDAGLVVALVLAERQLQPRLGTRKLHFMLQPKLVAAGVGLGRDRFLAVLRAHELLLAPQLTEYPCTTNSQHCLPVFPNQIKDRVVSQPNEVWVSDLTYLRTAAGFLYLSLVTDKYSRKVVGDHCGDTLAAAGCLQALGLALKELPAWAHPIHHSDQGSQYCCHEYVNALVGRGLTISMTERDHCAENALAERMNGILKSEYGLGQKIKTKLQARQLVAQGVQLYNERRPHTALAYRTPAAVHNTVGSARSCAASRLRSGSPTRLRSAAKRRNPTTTAKPTPHNNVTN
jgi:putative transposase